MKNKFSGFIASGQIHSFKNQPWGYFQRQLWLSGKDYFG
ncbi:hypothetical protein WC3_01648 [Escherichia coli KTE35]|nr:hypothetical protein WC3_01648 [Escherichia coli KTE35]EOU98451.1 hypothetical protein WEY_01648 [Escherichia coli KTE34]